LEMSQAGMSAAQQQFSWKEERVKLFDLYESILGRQGHCADIAYDLNPSSVN